MKTKKPYQSIGKTLMLAGAAMAMSLGASAQAQEMNFAHKLLGTPSGDMNGTQFRSTIIDPSSRGKVTTTNGSNLRVIPISNSTEQASQDHSCSICGVVESISITLRERTGTEAYDENALENISSRHAKRQHGILLTRNGTPLSLDSDKVPKKAATIYEIKVRMNDGTLRIVNANRLPDYTVGDYVRVISGAVTAA